MKKVICVVEDEVAINDLVCQYLRKEDYEVRSYYTYEEASAHVSDDDVHLWILDIMLDDKSGFDLIEEIRQQAGDIPVIFMSARDKEFDRIIGLEKGSDDLPGVYRDWVTYETNSIDSTDSVHHCNKRVHVWLSEW